MSTSVTKDVDSCPSKPTTTAPLRTAVAATRPSRTATPRKVTTPAMQPPRRRPMRVPTNSTSWFKRSLQRLPPRARPGRNTCEEKKMSQISEGVTSANVFDPNASSDDALRGLDIEAFLDLFIAELQNQDPLNPLDNAQILEQISQIREVGATDKLTETLDAVLLGQNLSSATSLIGKQVVALDSAGNEISGRVDKITVVNGTPRLHIGDNEVELNNVREVLPSDDSEEELTA
ncbi:MAG: hypothetical protein DWQ35_08265 [Planctomycetota bacterium]|nr:MAG: hypothetical protein DWQ35_08265 [Planctomycetota bacterium]REK22085.1 MAG: hypothetical protein DWQ42_18260 [Planctomycetota bacterium]REK44493.1 MAG: hypothetical protein DWQ46_09545 [Planctomycetota bacterium]